MTFANETAAAAASSPMKGTCPWPISESLSFLPPLISLNFAVPISQ